MSGGRIEPPWRRNGHPVRREYASGRWRYAVGTPAREHPQYEKALGIARKRRFNPWWIRSVGDVEAVLEGCWMDEAKGERVCQFFENVLRHTKDRFAGQPFLLIDWQRYDLLIPLFGWRRLHPEFGLEVRRFTRGSMWIPKKQGKTETCSGLALHGIGGGGSAGAVVLSAAGSRDQAKLIFNGAAKMVRRSPALQRSLEILRNIILYEKGDGTFQPVSAESGLQEGWDWSALLFDELHVQKTRTLWDTLSGGGAARLEPLQFAISTSGVYDPEAIGWEVWEYARQVREGIVSDTGYFALQYYAEKDSDWREARTWRRANPSLGITVAESFYAGQLKEALASPAKQNMFRRYYLNIWVQSAERWLNMERWEACGGAVDRGALRGRNCFAGIDLSQKIDFTSVVLVFPPDGGRLDGMDEPDGLWRVLPFFWLPAEMVETRMRQGQEFYGRWVENGLLEATPGNVVDYGLVREVLFGLADEFQIIEAPFDQYKATQLTTELMARGFPCVEFRQGAPSFHAPMVELEGLVESGLLAHGGNPILRWMADNLVVRRVGPNENMAPDRKSSKGKIDGMVAMLMGLGRAIVAQEAGFAYTGM